MPADGGVRARNQQRSYVDRVAGRAPMPAAVPRPRAGWPMTGRGPTAQPA